MNDRFHEIMDLRFTGYVLAYGLLGMGYEALWGWGGVDTQSLYWPCLHDFRRDSY